MDLKLRDFKRNSIFSINHGQNLLKMQITLRLSVIINSVIILTIGGFLKSSEVIHRHISFSHEYLYSPDNLKLKNTNQQLRGHNSNKGMHNFWFTPMVPISLGLLGRVRHVWCCWALRTTSILSLIRYHHLRVVVHQHWKHPGILLLGKINPSSSFVTHLAYLLGWCHAPSFLW